MGEMVEAKIDRKKEEKNSNEKNIESLFAKSRKK